MRLFIGIAIHEEARWRIHRAFCHLQPHFQKVKPSPWQGYHITLRFLGEIAEDEAARIGQALKAARFETASFTLRLSGLGRFAKRGGDVLWLGAAPCPELAPLRRELSRLLEGLGYPPEDQPFSPHLTLARGVRYLEDIQQLQACWELPEQREAVTRVVLFHSLQDAQGLKYEEIAAAELSGGR